MARARQPRLSESDLQSWKHLARFHAVLQQVSAAHGLPPTWQHPQRLTQLGDYLSLFLFALLNPVARTMRAVCAASQLPRVQHAVCTRPISLGSFSAAQHVVEPALLAEVFRQLSAAVQTPRGDPRLAEQPWQIVDSTLWAALPRMHWALYGGGRAGHPNRAVRLHLGLELRTDKPVRATITPGQRCERAVWAEHAAPGGAYVGDRYYGGDYGLLEQLTAQGCRYVVRLREPVVNEVVAEIAGGAAEPAAGVVRQAWVRLGRAATVSAGRAPVRLVWVEKPGVSLVLATNLPEAELSGELVALLYRQRWQVELFFRWLKCILGVRHWLAEGPGGVNVQLYLALIAAVLLQLYTGRRPSKRIWEMLQFYSLGWAEETDVAAALARELARPKKAKRPR